MRKLLAVGILAAIPIGICVLLVSVGGWLALLFFVGVIIGVSAVIVAALWATAVLFG